MNYTPIIPEFPVPKDGDYFFTQTLDYKKMQIKGKHMHTVLKITSKLLKQHLAYYGLRYAMVTEFTKRGKIHYHGYITFRSNVGEDEMEMFRVLMDDAIGHCDTITLIKDHQLVFNYMCKDLDKTNKIINYKFKNNQMIKNNIQRNIQWYYQAGAGGTPAPTASSPSATSRSYTSLKDLLN